MARGTAKSSLHTTQLQTLAQVNGSGWAGAPEALLTKAQAAAKRLPLLCGRLREPSVLLLTLGEIYTVAPWIRSSCN